MTPTIYLIGLIPGYFLASFMIYLFDEYEYADDDTKTWFIFLLTVFYPFTGIFFIVVFILGMILLVHNFFQKHLYRLFNRLSK